MRVKPGAEAFSLDPSRSKRPRVTASGHLAWIRRLPSLVSGSTIDVEAAHIRFGEPKAGKRRTGLGEKPSDRWAVPLSAELHRLDREAQHNTNERVWWELQGIDPIYVAMALWGCSGDDGLAEMIIREANRRVRQ